MQNCLSIISSTLFNFFNLLFQVTMGYPRGEVTDSLRNHKFDDCYASYILIGRKPNEVRQIISFWKYEHLQKNEINTPTCSIWISPVLVRTYPNSKAWRNHLENMVQLIQFVDPKLRNSLLSRAFYNFS